MLWLLKLHRFFFVSPECANVVPIGMRLALFCRMRGGFLFLESLKSSLRVLFFENTPFARTSSPRAGSFLPDFIVAIFARLKSAPNGFLKTETLPRAFQRVLLIIICIWPWSVATAIKPPRAMVLPQLNPVLGVVSSAFGWRLHPLLHRWQFHRGVDWLSSAGTPVRAVTAGKIIFAGWRAGFGRLVILDHGGGWESWYAHLQTLGVKKGAHVMPGETVGTVGSSGTTTGPHLHFELHYLGLAYDPMK